MPAKPNLKIVSGFSLIEMSIVLVIIGLLLGGLLLPLSTQQEINNIKKTEQIIDDTLDAIYGYIYINKYLPCPDTNGDGLENVVSDATCIALPDSPPDCCAAQQGDIPWQTLGSPKGDSFRGNILAYRIDEQYQKRFSTSTAHTVCKITSSSPAPQMRVCTDGSDTASCSASSITTSAGIAVWSFGKNGWGATNDQGGVNQAPTSAFETENTDDDNDLVRAIRTNDTASVGEFDDILSFISHETLCAKMVDAGFVQE